MDKRLKTACPHVPLHNSRFLAPLMGGIRSMMYDGSYVPYRRLGNRNRTEGWSELWTFPAGTYDVTGDRREDRR